LTRKQTAWKNKVKIKSWISYPLGSCGVLLQGVTKAFSKAYHKLDVRQKLVRLGRRAGSWLLVMCSRVRSLDVYSVGLDVEAQCPLIYHLLTTSQSRVVACERPPAALRHKDNLFLSVLFCPCTFISYHFCLPGAAWRRGFM